MEKTIASEAYREFVEKLVVVRVDKGVSQTALAEKLGRPQQFVSRYENLERRIDVWEFVVIANALGVDASKAIGELAETLND